MKTYHINQDEEVRYLGNFSRHSVVVDGKKYKTSEHYFQAAKFFDTDPDWAKQVAKADWPSAAKKLGKDRKHKIKDNWDKKWALFHMKKVLIAKAQQHKIIYDQLMATGDAKIVERADWDAIWGDGPNRDGKNQLGKLWMEVREEFREGKYEVPK